MSQTRADRVQGDECYTPARFTKLARDVMGAIDLDPASNALANKFVRARKYFSIRDDGLRKRWRGRVWLNCPYSAPAPWAAKLLASYAAGDVRESISLFNSRTGSSWFHPLAAQAWRCEAKTRIRFWGPSTTGTTGWADNVFFYTGPNPDRFAAVFAHVGRIVPPAVTKGVTVERVCSVCTRSLAGMRMDAEQCSAACRQRAYRQRKAPSSLAVVAPAVVTEGVTGSCAWCSSSLHGHPKSCPGCGLAFGELADVLIAMRKAYYAAGTDPVPLVRALRAIACVDLADRILRTAGGVPGELGNAHAVDRRKKPQRRLRT